MTKLTPALEADVLSIISVWREAPLPIIDRRIQDLRDEAARRDAAEERSQWRKDDMDAMLNGLVAKLPDAPPDADLVARLNAASRDDRLADGMLYRQAAAAIEALRADLAESARVISRWSEMYAEMETRAEAAEARVEALRGVLDKYRAGIVTHVQMTGPVFGGTNSRQLKIAFEADQALAAGGTDA